MTLTSLAYQKGKGCLSVAYSKEVAVQLTWAAVWWLVELASWMVLPEEGSFLPLFAHPILPVGQLCSVTHDKAGGRGVTFLASFKLHHFTKWSNKATVGRGRNKGLLTFLQADTLAHLVTLNL